MYKKHLLMVRLAILILSVAVTVAILYSGVESDFQPVGVFITTAIAGIVVFAIIDDYDDTKPII